MKYIRRISYANMKYKKCMIPNVLPAVALYGHLTHDYNLEHITNSFITLNTITAYAMFYVDNYITQLEQWRAQEAQYEDKTEPPTWNFHIVNENMHKIKLYQVAGTLSSDISLQLVGLLFQIWCCVCAKFEINISFETFCCILSTI